tara:strand:- start:58 stop:1266 length:1209 start_codon:yes stop_codon:yes gene_type:complete
MAKKKLTICFVTQEYPEETGWGGIGTYTFEMAHGLARLGHRVFVVSRALQDQQIYQEQDGVTVYRILPRLSFDKCRVFWRLNRLWEGYHLAVALLLRKLICKYDIDIIETPTLNGETVFFQYWKRHFPLVVRIHSCVIKEMALGKARDRIFLRINRFYERRATMLAKGVSAPSNAIARDNFSYLPIQKKDIKIIANPIDSQGAIANYQKDIGQESTVLFVGRFDQLKGAHILARAMPLVWEHCPDVCFLFVGKDGKAPDDGIMSKWILSQASSDRKSQVRFKTHISRDKLIKIYHQATIVAVPSFSEAFGYVCVEAMLAGVPVVASRIGSLQEFIENGKTGMLIKPGDPESLARAIVDLLGNRQLRENITRVAKDKVSKHYSPEVICKQMVNFYQSVIDKNK